MTEEQSAEETKHRMRRIERGRIVLGDILPDAAVLDENEKESLLLVLDDTKILDDIIKAVDADDSSLIKQFHEQLKIDPFTGRVTYLKLDRAGYHLYRLLYSFKVPPSIRLLKHLVGLSLVNCTGLSIELNHLPVLQEIKFTDCNRELFGTIPEGLHLPKVKKLEMVDFELGNHYQLFQSFSGIIEEIYLSFNDWSGDFDRNRVECQLFFDALKNNGRLSGLRQNLKKVTMACCGLNNTDFRWYMVEFHRLYPNLLELNLSYNSDIDSFQGIAEDIREEYDDGNDTIKDDTQLINWNLRKLILPDNPSCYNLSEDWSSENPNHIACKEIANVMDFLHIFQGITHLSGYLSSYDHSLYHPTVENMLRENTMRACLSEGVLSKKMPSVLALWPFILHKVHNDSVKEIYQLEYDIDRWDEDIERRNNTTTNEGEAKYMGPVEPKREDYSSIDEYNHYFDQFREECEYDPVNEKKEYLALIESKKDASVVYELLCRNATSPPHTNILLQRTHHNKQHTEENKKGEENGDKNED